MGQLTSQLTTTRAMAHAAGMAAIVMAWGPCAIAEDAILLHEDFEADLATRVQVQHASQPYDAHVIGLTEERAQSGSHSLEMDATHLHGFAAYLAPRSDETPRVTWGSLGGPGSFVLPSLDIPLRTDRGYMLTLSLWVESASPQNPVRISVETIADTDYGPIRTETYLDQVIAEPTGEWIKLEQELSSTLIEQLDAAGAKTEGLALSAISVNSFANSRLRTTVYADDITLREVPLSAVADHRQRREAGRPEPPTLRRYPQVEDLFAWGVYGSLLDVGDWPDPYDRSEGQADVRRQQAERVRAGADWMLLDLRRHYCNVCVQGGGMLFPEEGESAYDYVKACLDKCAEYGVRLAPSTYLTQHYTAAPREQCGEAMRKTVGMFGDHPGLLAYWLVDEPGGSTADDFYWGKQTVEALDAAHPALCTCNSISSIREFASVLPLLCIDYYPIAPVPAGDKGCWAVGDSVRYARELGAERIWLLPQVFGQSSWRAPSREEFAIQIWSSVAEGATGILPYAYADRPEWHNPRNEYGHLIDPYGNPSPAWDEMRRLGPHLRSAGALLAGARRLPDGAAVAQTPHFVVSNAGRRRPAVVARMFADERRNARYLVAYNNTLHYRQSVGIAIRDLAEHEGVVDLFAVREASPEGNVLRVLLPPGEGRLYAVGEKDALAAVEQDVLASRVDIERDLLELEVRVAERMGTNAAPVKAVLVEARDLAEQGELRAGLVRLAAACDALSDANEANATLQDVSGAVEDSRAILGQLNQSMSRRLTGGDSAFDRDAPEVQAAIQTMVDLPRRFYSLQSHLLRDGPEGLAGEAEALRDDVRQFRARLGVFVVP